MRKSKYYNVLLDTLKCLEVKESKLEVWEQITKEDVKYKIGYINSLIQRCKTALENEYLKEEDLKEGDEKEEDCIQETINKDIEVYIKENKLNIKEIKEELLNNTKELSEIVIMLLLTTKINYIKEKDEESMYYFYLENIKYKSHGLYIKLLDYKNYNLKDFDDYIDGILKFDRLNNAILEISKEGNINKVKEKLENHISKLRNINKEEYEKEMYFNGVETTKEIELEIYTELNEIYNKVFR